MLDVLRLSGKSLASVNYRTIVVRNVNQLHRTQFIKSNEIQ